jgi:hypothetical protein
MTDINQQLMVAIVLLGIIILCILWLIYHKNKQNKNKNSLKLDISSSQIKPKENIISYASTIEHDWDNAIDLISTIYFKHPIEGDKLQRVLFSDSYHQKLQIHGMNNEKKHCKLLSGHQYDGLFLSMPLASRYSAISGMDFSHFIQYIQRIAIFVDGDVDTPSMQDTLIKAEKIKDLATSSCDYLQLKILLKEPTPTKNLIEWLQQTEKYQSISANQCIYSIDSKLIYTIEWPQQDYTQVLYFYYTPALVDPKLNGLGLMCEDIDVLLQTFSGMVCTPDNQVLDYDMYQQINKNIEILQSNLNAHQLYMGSASIKRLLEYAK